MPFLLRIQIKGLCLSSSKRSDLKSSLPPSNTLITFYILNKNPMKVCPQVLDFWLIGDLIKLTTKNSDHGEGFSSLWAETLRSPCLKKRTYLRSPHSTQEQHSKQDTETRSSQCSQNKLQQGPGRSSLSV